MTTTESTPDAAARALFVELTGTDPAGVWSSPGRVNLIGEHTDYNDGFVFPFAIEHRTYVALGERADARIRVASTFDDGVVEVAIADLDFPGAPRRRPGVGDVSTRCGVGPDRRDRCGRGIPHRRRSRDRLRRPRRRGPLLLRRHRGRRRVGARRDVEPRTRPGRPGQGRAHRRERGRRRAHRDHGPDDVDARALGRGDLPRLPIVRSTGRRPRLRCGRPRTARDRYAREALALHRRLPRAPRVVRARCRARWACPPSAT